MNCLFLFPHLRFPNEFGGQRSRELIQFFAKKDNVSVTAFVPNVDPLTSKKAYTSLFFWRTYKRSPSFNELRFFVPATARFGFSGRFLYSFFCFFITFLYLLINIKKYDVVYVTTHPILFSLSILPFRAFFRFKLIVEVRDIPFDVALDRNLVPFPHFLSPIYFYIESLLLRSSDLVVTYSHKMVDILNSRSTLQNVLYAPIGLDPIVHYSSNPLIFSRDKISFVFMGTIGNVIDISTFFNLPNLLDKYGIFSTIDIFGSGHLSDDLQKLVKKNNFRVFFKGTINKFDVISFCSSYSFALYPLPDSKAVSASLGNKFFDYASSRTPIIVLGSSGEVASLVNKYNIGYCSDSLDELALMISNHVNKNISFNNGFDNLYNDLSKDSILNNIYLSVKNL